MKIKVGSVGELVVEILRKEVNQPFDSPADFVGPFASGAPAIFIDALANLGVRCGFIGPVGNDDFGKFLIERQKKSGVDTNHIIVLDGYTTGTAFNASFGDGSRKFIYHLSHAAPGQFRPEHLDPKYLSQLEFLHISGNVLTISESSREACYQAVKTVRRAGGKISFDPNLRVEMMNIEKVRKLCYPVIENAYLVLPTEEEIRMLTGIDEVEVASDKLLREGVEIVAIKEGKRGSCVFTREETFHAPGFEVEEVDPTGAGDCYDAGFVFGLLHRWDMRKTANFANALGALAVTKRGAMEGTVSFRKVEEFINKRKKRKE